MSTQVLEAHQELERELLRLTAEYQSAVQAAMLAYSAGVAAAQNKFEQQLRSTS